MECVFSVCFSMLVNNKQTGFFSPSCGLCQGCPLSLFLFVLSMNVLSCQFHYAESSNKLLGFKWASICSSISHLIFANDIFIFLQTVKEDCLTFKAILDKFCQLSSQRLNALKTRVIFFPNVLDVHHPMVLHVLNIPAALPSNYLVFPAMTNKRSVKSFNFALDHISKKIQTWNYVSFSCGDRKT